MKILDQFYSLLQPGWRVLDLGAGEGKQAEHMAKLGMKVIAVDRKPSKKKDASISWNTLPIQEWMAKFSNDDFFDAVLARNSLQSFEKAVVQGELLPILSNHLKSGGLFAIETFYKEPVPPFDHPFKSLWNETELKKSFAGWEVIASEMQEEHVPDLSGRPRDFYKTGLLVRRP